jgi:predicted nucleic-acid-binding Zn-ribbon protein
MENKNKCPKCGSSEYTPIVSGLPSSEGFEKANRGEIILGGCCISFDSKNRVCKKCGYDY